MTNLRERLQVGDPARTARPLDADEVAAMRRAMGSARPQPRRWPIAAGLTLAVSVLVAAVVLWPRPTTPVSAPMPVAPVATAPVVPVRAAPVPVVAEVRPPRPRRVMHPPAPPTEPAQVKEIRFVTASGTQILWTVRSSEEGA